MSDNETPFVGFFLESTNDRTGLFFVRTATASEEEEEEREEEEPI